MTLALNSSSVQKSGKSLAFNLDSEFKNLDPDLQKKINNLSNKDFCLFYNFVISKSEPKGVQKLEENDKDKNKSVLTSQLISKVNAKSESGFFYDTFERIATEALNRIEKTTKTQNSLLSLLGFPNSDPKICLDERIAEQQTNPHLTKLQEQKKTTKSNLPLNK
jgi:hypothetical protein